MQTFLAFPSYKKSAKALDYRRLGKQRVEAWQILNILLQLRKNPNKKIAWMNHPAVKMWENKEYALCKYGIKICEEWAIARGYKDTMLSRFNKILLKLTLSYAAGYKISITNPKWFNNKNFFKSHRAALLAKDFEFYKKFNWKEKPEINYIWPV